MRHPLPWTARLSHRNPDSWHVVDANDNPVTGWGNVLQDKKTAQLIAESVNKQAQLSANMKRVKRGAANHERTRAHLRE